MTTNEKIDLALWVLLIVLGLGLLVDIGIQHFKKRKKV